VFDCTPGTEYEYRIDILIHWEWKGIVIPGGDPGKGTDGGFPEGGHGTLELSAQEICGHGSY
jgi:hypothetical protein